MATRETNMNARTAYRQAYYLRNLDKIKAYRKAYYLNNREKFKESGRKRYLANRGAVLDKCRTYRQKNRTAILARHWPLETLFRVQLGHAKVADKKSKRQFDATAAQLVEIWNQQHGLCAITGLPMSQQQNRLDTASIDRIDNQVGHITSNLQLVCKFINLGKWHHQRGSRCIPQEPNLQR